ncbi:hypothetical protein A1Q1_01373 [Trichosporon asahii var. asahii CBS 2479]|uniref:Uncharacterized protein n=1 Tax=Trichosporon asahii var. asahii (strain ATCC 90039 / CBS 2479 / JCM 2466 / KCTC 7840 / NBRC 103889/ NCYC 2677 / UAMH 7654) TaxID=1186058 RepID=J6EXU2_TRIAS|nr:hypothetical protein A1Q1_01373 [Trichosporon asahii var. asahii CBS 2479]EJT49469.1 hypothetical protein A1Q1_01373 [Trichosporon asahii var. asahii CBS 2479]
MGASQSSQASQKPDHVVSAPAGTSVEQPSSGKKPQTTDELVRQKLASESANLRQQEAEILSSISSALEKENLDREKPGMSSEALGRDIEEVREKVERITNDRKNRENPDLAKAKDAVVVCYTNNPTTPLDCWREVDAFKAEVNKLEAVSYRFWMAI